MLKKLLAMLICVCLCTSFFATMTLVSAAETEAVDSAYILGDFPMDGYHIDVRQHGWKAEPADYAMNSAWYKTEGDKTYLSVNGANGNTRAFLNKNVSSGNFVVEFDVMPTSTASLSVGNDWDKQESAETAYHTTLFSGIGAAGEWGSYKAYITVIPNGEVAKVSGLLFEGENLIQSKTVELTFAKVGHIAFFGGSWSGTYGVDNVKIYETYEKWYGYNTCDSKTGFLAYSNDSNLWYASIIDETETAGRKYLKATSSGYGSLGAVMTNTINSTDGYFTAEFDYMGSQNLKFATSNQSAKSTDGVALNASKTEFNSYRVNCAFVDADTLSVDLYTNGTYTSTTSVELGDVTEIGVLYFGGWSNQALDNIKVYRPASKEQPSVNITFSHSNIYSKNDVTNEKDGWMVAIKDDETTGEKYATPVDQYRFILTPVATELSDIFEAEFSLKGNLNADGTEYLMPSVTLRTGNGTNYSGISVPIANTTQEWNDYKLVVNTAKETYDLYVNGTQTVFGEAYTWIILEGQAKDDLKAIGFVRWAAGWAVKNIKITNLGFAPTGHKFVLSDDSVADTTDNAEKSIKSVSVNFTETDIRNITARAVDSEGTNVPVKAVLSNNVVTVTPTSGAFADNTTYTVTIPVGYVNAGGLLGDSYSVTFTTSDIELSASAEFTETVFAKDGTVSASFNWTKGTAAVDVKFVIAAYSDERLIGARLLPENLAANTYSGSTPLTLTLADDADELRLFVFENELSPVLEIVPVATPGN